MNSTTNCVNTKERVFSANLFYLFLSQFMGSISFSAYLFVLPVYLVSISGEPATAGVATGIFTAFSMTMRLIVGKHLDKYGCKMPVLISITIYTLSGIFYVTAFNPLTVYLLRSIQGIGWGVFFVCTFTMASKLTTGSGRGQTLGLFMTALPVGMALGPVAGEYLHISLGSSLTFMIISLISSVPIILLLFFKEQNSPVNKLEKSTLFPRSSILPSTLALIINVAFGSIITFLPLLGLSRGIANVGIFFTLYGLVVVTTRPIGGRLVDHFGQRMIVLPSLIILCLSIVLIAFSESLATIIAAGLFFGLGLSFSFPAIMTLCVSLCPMQERGRAMAIFTFAIDLGVGIGSMGLGFVLLYTDYKIIFLISAMLVFIGFLLWSRCTTKQN